MGTCSVSPQPASSEPCVPSIYDTVSLPDPSPEQLCKALCFTVINNWSQLCGRAESLQQVCEWKLPSIPNHPLEAQQNKLSKWLPPGHDYVWGRQPVRYIKKKNCYRGRAKGPLHFLHLKESASSSFLCLKRMCGDFKSSLRMCLMCMCALHMYALTDMLACACGGQKSTSHVLLCSLYLTIWVRVSHWTWKSVVTSPRNPSVPASQVLTL